MLADNESVYLYGRGRIVQVDSVDREYFLGDALGSVRQLTDENGSVTLARSYAPYGEVMTSAGDGETSYSFTGEWMDSGTSLVYLRARYYEPGIGMFISRDIWEGSKMRPASYNAWLYVYANPVNFTDPIGMYPREYCAQLLDPIAREDCLNGVGPDINNYEPTQPPYEVSFWLSNAYAEKIANNLAPIYDKENQLVRETHQAQFKIKGYEYTCQIQDDTNRCAPETICNQNFCGQVVIAAILSTFDDNIAAHHVVEALQPTHLGCDGTSGHELAKFINDQYSGYIRARWISDVFREDQMPSILKSEMSQGHLVFPGASLLDGTYNELGSDGESIGHWVLITGLSGEWDYSNSESIWNWVRIFNPFDNQTEYYWWEDFRKAWNEDSFANYDTLIIMPQAPPFSIR